MDEPLGIIRKHNPVKRMFMGHKVKESVIG